MKPDKRLNKIYQQTVLIKYSDLEIYDKWKILSERSLNVVDSKKFKNMIAGGSSVKSLFDWLLIERAIKELEKEY